MLLYDWGYDGVGLLKNRDEIGLLSERAIAISGLVLIVVVVVVVVAAAAEEEAVARTISVQVVRIVVLLFVVPKGLGA